VSPAPDTSNTSFAVVGMSVMDPSFSKSVEPFWPLVTRILELRSFTSFAPNSLISSPFVQSVLNIWHTSLLFGVIKVTFG